MHRRLLRLSERRRASTASRCSTRYMAQWSRWSCSWLHGLERRLGASIAGRQGGVPRYRSRPAWSWAFDESFEGIYASPVCVGTCTRYSTHWGYRNSSQGISTGGMTLLHMATMQPERVEAMVLIGATSYFPEQARQIMRELTSRIETRRRGRGCANFHQGDEQIRLLYSQFHGFKDSYDDMNFTRPFC